MGYRMVKFNVTPEENEQIDAVIKVPKEPRSIIHGVVIDECNKPLKDAVVKLLTMNCDNKHLEPVTHTFTDENGEFLLGPLCAHVKYVIKVWINHVKIREVIIRPDKDDGECLKKQPCHKPPCKEAEICEEVDGCEEISQYPDELVNEEYNYPESKVRPRVNMRNWKNTDR